ncbi:hypothetical protein ANCDUO_25729 [Ancylostoma duodenale]|uniref:Uncharacterized protein n=1 Tax=Ancylostoma duodenale TaxID=51022 RepID=A0A0C2C3K9_9BILA|nr:hypothetical protein ANCDUO_25729 [Ancylostoma duodenale]
MHCNLGLCSADVCAEDFNYAFYGQLENTIRSAPETDYIMRVHRWKGIGTRNVDGEKLINLAEPHDLAIANTSFAKRRCQKITYSSGRRETEIVHVLVRRGWLKTVKDGKVITVEDAVGQHRVRSSGLGHPMPQAIEIGSQAKNKVMETQSEDSETAS